MNRHWEDLNSKPFLAEAARLLKADQETEAQNHLRKAVIINTFQPLSTCARKEFFDGVRTKKGEQYDKYFVNINRSWRRLQCYVGKTGRTSALPAVVPPISPALWRNLEAAPAQRLPYQPQALYSPPQQRSQETPLHAAPPPYRSAQDTEVPLYAPTPNTQPQALQQDSHADSEELKYLPLVNPDGQSRHQRDHAATLSNQASQVDDNVSNQVAARHTPTPSGLNLPRQWNSPGATVQNFNFDFRNAFQNATINFANGSLPDAVFSGIKSLGDVPNINPRIFEDLD
jgi:hypothetical protein